MPEKVKIFQLRVRAKITSQNWRSDLVQIWLIRKSKTTGIASYFEDFASEVSAKDGLKLRCKNVKLFLREPLGFGGGSIFFKMGLRPTSIAQANAATHRQVRNTLWTKYI